MWTKKQFNRHMYMFTTYVPGQGLKWDIMNLRRDFNF